MAKVQSYQQACTKEERAMVKHYGLPGAGDISLDEKLDRKTALKEYKKVCDQFLIQLNGQKNPDSFGLSHLTDHLNFLGEIFQKHENNPEASAHYYELADICESQRNNPEQLFKPFPHWDQLKGRIYLEKQAKENSTQNNVKKLKTPVVQIQSASKTQINYGVSPFVIPLRTFDLNKKAIKNDTPNAAPVARTNPFKNGFGSL